jgi:hypothetical protein
MADASTTPDAEAELSALRDLVWDASAGLADRDRAMLDLHLRQGLEGAELGEAMGVTASNAYVMLNRLRTQVERSLGALLIARLGRDDCEELDGILVDWDGRFSPLIRKRVARHVDDCDVCSDRRGAMVSPMTLLSGVPVVAAPLSLRDRVVNDTELVAYTGSGTPFMKRRRNQAVAAGAAAIVIAGTALLWPGGADDPASTTTASETSTPTAEPTPTETPSATPSGNLTAGTLSVSTTLIDLGSDGISAPVQLTNTGNTSVRFRVGTTVPWLSLSTAGGSIPGGGSATLLVSAQRSNLSEGRSTGAISIVWDGGTAPVTVRVTQERPPTVGRPILGGSTCGSGGRTVKVSVTASDASGLDSVVLTWTGPSDSGSVTMSGSGSSWSGAMGPFPVGGQVTMSVTATDTSGNSTTGPKTTSNVDPCPQ